jgi:N-acetylglucosamine transport system permease protein
MEIATRRVNRSIIWVWTAGTILLFVWLILSSLKSNAVIFTRLWSLPDGVHLENYQTAWSVLNLGQATLNSALVVGLSTAVIVALSAPAAYALSRVPFRGAALVTMLFIIGIGVPVQVLLIPLVTLLARFHLANSLFGLGLIYVSISLPFTVYLLTGYFKSLPFELEEAAAIDGAGPFTTALRVMMPLAQPGLVTAAILNAVLLWNEYLLALTILSDNSQYTLALAILNMYGSMKYSANWAGLFAGLVIVVIPMIVLYTWLSGRIIEGLTLGSSK